MQVVKCISVIFVITYFNFFSSFSFCLAQTTSSASNPILTAVPILRISPDARGRAMGNAGVAISPDVNSTFWNPSKLAFLEKEWNFGISYSPFFPNIVEDMRFYYFSAAKKLTEKQSIAISSRYFTKGTLTLIDSLGNSKTNALGNDFSLDMSFAQKVSEKLSLAATFRYIRSSELFFESASNAIISKQNVGTLDVSMFYTTKFSIHQKEVHWNLGMNISNIGTPISYQANREEYLPTNLAIGTALIHQLNSNTTFSFAFDINKLLVPTPNGNFTRPPRKLISSIFNSFSDAPNGFREEMQELILALGGEYTYKKLSLRTGYYQESRNKGDNRYFTFGAGLNYKAVGLNASYIKTTNDSPNDKTFQISLICAFNSSKKS